MPGSPDTSTTVNPAAAARNAPAALRNREPILAVLRRVLPAKGIVLEIASGTGEHAVHFAAAMPSLAWQPSDPDADARGSIAAHAAIARLPNLRAPLALDAAAWPWPARSADAVVCINMIHIAPWRAAEGLMRGAGALLPRGGVLALYGPYREAGVATTPSNEAFDRSLRSRDPEWGLRQLGDVAALAEQNGLMFAERVTMPANNLMAIFRRT
jgi:SAM-dependent methyltransferase